MVDEETCILLSFKVVEENGKRKGFGFVQFDKEDSGMAAASALNDTISKGKKLYVSIFVQKSKNDNRLQIFSNTPNLALYLEVVCYIGLELATNITEACNNRVFGQIVLLLVQIVTTTIRLLEESANLKGLQDGHFRQEEEAFVVLSRKHRNDPIKIKEVISMVVNSLTSLWNLDIEVKLLLQGDGTTPASILLFLFHEMHFKEGGKSGTKPYVIETEQQCVSHHIFSHMMGKRLVLIELELHHRKTCRCIQMLTFGGEGVIVSRPNLRVAGASVYAWLYDYEYAYMIKTTIHTSPSSFPKLVESLFENGYDIVSGGTENHLMLVKLRDNGTDGLRAEFATNPEKLFFEFENAGVLITDQKISRMFKVVEDSRATGIFVMIITGDNQNIAEAICREICVFGADEDIYSRSPTRKEFMSTLRDPKVHLRQNDGLMFSKVEPKHKQKIVRLLKKDVEVVAKTIDGMNDASTLKLAKIVD